MKKIRPVRQTTIRSEQNFPTRSGMVWHFLQGSKRWFVLSIVFACLTSVLDLLNPKIISYTVDSVIDSKPSALTGPARALIESSGGAEGLRNHLWLVAAAVCVVADMSKAGISIDRLRYIMNSETEQDKKDAKMPPMDRDISFQHVSYQYENGSSEVLKDVTFTIPAGSTVGILGGTGSGKSTLMYLLDRLYPLSPENGRIEIGGVDIADISSDWLRRNIGMVLQEPFLFSRTLEENIAIASGQEPEDGKDGDHSRLARVRSAARIARLDETITHFAKGYDTFVGERGVTLSGGQKQRTAIAQMLIRKPPIMVFDDSLSAVDAETDAEIRRALRENVGSATVILIAHRLTTLMHADQILVMDQGRLVQRGTHEELLAQDGIYRQIYDLQVRQSGSR